MPTPSSDLVINELAIFDSPVWIVDNFYKDLGAVLEYERHHVAYDVDRTGVFGGAESVHSYSTTAHVQLFSALAQVPLASDHTWQPSGIFRRRRRCDQPRSAKHLDRADWTAISYLDATPASDQTLAELGTHFYRRLDEPATSTTGASRSSSDIVTTVRFKPNRTILFRGNELMHSAGSGCGDDLEESRLTQHFYLKHVGSASEAMRG